MTEQERMDKMIDETNICDTVVSLTLSNDKGETKRKSRIKEEKNEHDCSQW